MRLTSLPFSQVSHHPPAAAHHAISDRGWTLRQEITVASKFRGKYLSIMPLGKRWCSSELLKHSLQSSDGVDSGCDANTAVIYGTQMIIDNYIVPLPDQGM